MRKTAWWFLLIVALAVLQARAAQQLRLFIWSEYIDPAIVKQFEAQFDCKVTIDLYEEAESMLAKVQGGGVSLYDVVVPPDHLVKAMVALNLLAPLRHGNLPNLRTSTRGSPTRRMTGATSSRRPTSGERWGCSTGRSRA